MWQPTTRSSAYVSSAYVIVAFDLQVCQGGCSKRTPYGANEDQTGSDEEMSSESKGLAHEHP